MDSGSTNWSKVFDQLVTFLYTDDLEASTAFYGDTIGLPLALDQGACRIFETSPGGFVGVCAAGEHRQADPGGVIVTLVTDDVDGWYRRLKARGVDFETAPAENDKYNIYHCFLRDPAGYQIEIQSFRDPAWPKPG